MFILEQVSAVNDLKGINPHRGFPGGSDDKASAHNAGYLGLIPGSGRSPGEGNGNPLQYSGLENSMDGGSWWATVHGVAKSWTRLSDFSLSLSQGNKRVPKHCLLSGKRSSNTKDNVSVVKTPTSVSMVKISLKCSTTRSTGTNEMILTFSDPCDINKGKLGL